MTPVLATWFTRQLVFDGLVNGATIGLLALGLVLVYRSTRVINFAAVSPTYTLEASTLEETVVSKKTVGGKTEKWTLTCEKKGKVLQTVKVNVERGDLARVNLAECRRKF